MLLPELEIPISIESFETNLEYFIGKYKDLEDLPNLTHKKSDIGYMGYRYTIFLKSNDSGSTSLLKIGEIDVIKIHEERVEVNVAVFILQNFKEWERFFVDFYIMVLRKWHPELSPWMYSVEEIVTSERDEVIFRTLHSCLPEVSTDLFESIKEYLTLGILNGNHASDNELITSLTDNERKNILEKYQLEMSKGLPENYIIESSSDNRKHNVRPKTKKRFQQLKEIKEKNPYLSQVGVVIRYNMNHPEEEQIKVYDLQYAYKAMGEKWKTDKDLK